jgi:hypothetical protein
VRREKAIETIALPPQEKEALKMRYLLKSALTVTLLAAAITGCSYYEGMRPPSANIQDVILKENDFKVLKTHLLGKASCSYVLGFIPIGDPNIVSQAQIQIRDQVDMTGKAAALVNWTEDASSLNFFVIRKDTVILTADAIEYTK